jgi:hypothetical protein
MGRNPALSRDQSTSPGRRYVLPADHGAYPIVAAIAVIVMLLRCQLTIDVFNHTIDEPFHIAAAVGLYEAHKHVADVTHPPLAWLVAGIALKHDGVDVPQLHGSQTVLDFTGMDQVASSALFHQKAGYWRVLTDVRKAMLVFPVIAMVYLYQLGKWLSNSLVAMLAVIFCSTDPTLLAHSGLVNNDVAACAAFLAGLYHGLRWLVTPTWGRALVAGIAFGLGVGTKFTVLLLFPSLLLIQLFRLLPVFWMHNLKHRWKTYFARWPSIGQVALCAAAGFVSLWSVYLFNIGPMQDQHFFDYTPKWNSIPAFVRGMPIPMPSFVLGLIYQVVHSQAGHQSYLNAIRYAHKGPVEFFFQSLLMKQTLAFIALVGTAAVAWLRMRPRRPWQSLLIVAPIAVYMTISATGSIMIGIRHLLPIIPLMYLFGCFVLARGRVTLLVIALSAVSFIETLALHPDYLPFMNIASGGPRRGLMFFADSNLDWGQDVARLATWLRVSPQARNRPYTLRLFASNEAELLTELALNPKAQTETPHGLFAISKSTRVGFTNFDPETNGLSSSPEDYSWLRFYPKIAEIGYGIEVYDLGDAPATNVASAE